ncbi:MAG: Rieske 2Fe-2S domain-containing protein [Methylophilaceae bacterium]|uniref:Rieske 2Fe-2S domain-containing protein n=1 Tax=Methylibium sp. TaxID=2067992 RepID=UPI00359A5372
MSPSTEAPFAHADRTAAPKRYADADTRLIQNCWYVAAFSGDIGTSLTERWILDRNVVFYRTRAGEVVALDNRCPHRSYPLSRGRLVNDQVTCGYHGLTFDATGACVRVPMLRNVPPNLGVTRYPVIERGPLVWIWVGEPEVADPSAIPHHFLPPGEAGWETLCGYAYVNSNYVHMHENLQDLTHFAYLHESSIGVPDFASVPVEVNVQGDQVLTVRRHMDATPPALWKGVFKLSDNQLLSRIIESCFETPAHIGALQTMLISPPSPDMPSDYKIQVLHYLTPATQNGFHYFWAHMRDFQQGDAGMSAVLRDGYTGAFAEDKDALEAIAFLQQNDKRREFKEQSFASDRPGIAVRQVIERLATAQP